ncbi:hypothetical protein K461DRAFT_272353 [Myriangium duriaei CBS 260.36]|uniref:Uncharacterized protein n=1 Tax=Myriangium duriaei CBS 260.36 TaxID=1168546 RepID=A0A9P4ISS5_9PEZI|nr:hypothetical protein K461DRAFT_272353 [Myriangium duriaei CBS 260.36]
MSKSYHSTGRATPVGVIEDKSIYFSGSQKPKGHGESIQEAMNSLTAHNKSGTKRKTRCNDIVRVLLETTKALFRKSNPGSPGRLGRPRRPTRPGHPHDPGTPKDRNDPGSPGDPEDPEDP